MIKQRAERSASRSASRISAVEAEPPATLIVAWSKGGSDRVDLSGWLASAGPVLSSLKDPDIFARAAVGEHDAAVTWDDDEGDLAIDAFHLERLAEEQLR